MALERNYNVPLRKGFMKAPKYKRAKKAVNTLKIFIKKHMKSDEVKLGKNLNMEIWKHGIKNPPHHVKITAIKSDDGIVKVELEGVEYKEMTKEEKEQAQKQKKKKEAPKAEEKPKEEVKEEKKEEVKEEKTEKKKSEEKPKEEKQESKKEAVKVDKKETKVKKTKEEPKKK